MKRELNIQKGTLINSRYEILRELGKGTYAIVYQVYDRKMQMQKALKVFGRREENLSLIPILRNEARILAQLNAVGIVRIYDFDDSGEYIFLDMEYVEGKNLDDYLKENELSKAEKKDFAIRIAEAVAYAHKQGVIHRDIKPKNILVSAEQEIKITDFGIADNLQENSEARKQIGTKAYAPPEKLLGAEDNATTDLFSLGVTLYELFYGSYPFKLNIRNVPDYDLPDALQNSGEELDIILRRCLEKEPEQRPGDADTVVKALTALRVESRRIVPTIVTKIIKIIGRQSPVDDTEIKRGFKGLLVLALLLIVCMPFYFFNIINDVKPLIPTVSEERKIGINRVPYTFYRNLQEVGFSPASLTLKKGDYVEIKDEEGKTVFAFEYADEPALQISFSDKAVIVNSKVRGRYVKDTADFLLLDEYIDFLSTSIDIPAVVLGKLNNPSLTVQLDSAATLNQLYELPFMTKHLNLGNSADLTDLGALQKLEYLQSLSLENVPSLREKLPSLKKLKTLNVASTDLTSLSQLPTLPDLENLSLRNNSLQTLNGIQKFGKLKRLDIRNNNRLTEEEALKKLPFLDDLAQDKEPFFKVNPHKAEVTERIIREENRFVLGNIPQYLLLFLGIVFLWQALRLLLKVNRLPSSPFFKTQKSKAIESALATIDEKIATEQYCSPQKDNAITYLDAALKKEPRNYLLLKKKKEILNLIRKKIKIYLKDKDFEPAWQMANATLTIFPDHKIGKFKDASLRQLTAHNEAIKFINVAGGIFEMGDFTKAKTQPLHKVEVSSFMISETPITVAQFCQFLNAVGNQRERDTAWVDLTSPFAQITKKDEAYLPIEPYQAFPVVEVSWHGAKNFADWMGGSLPTEAQWEYAARNRGQKILYACGNSINHQQANYQMSESEKQWQNLTPVKKYPASKLGLFDMNGNVLEWCADVYDRSYYQRSPLKDPQGPRLTRQNPDGDTHAVRGGAWCLAQEKMITFNRGAANSSTRNNFIGFRVVKNV